MKDRDKKSRKLGLPGREKVRSQGSGVRYCTRCGRVEAVDRREVGSVRTGSVFEIYTQVTVWMAVMVCHGVVSSRYINLR